MALGSPGSDAYGQPVGLERAPKALNEGAAAPDYCSPLRIQMEYPSGKRVKKGKNKNLSFVKRFVMLN